MQSIHIPKFKRFQTLLLLGKRQFQPFCPLPQLSVFTQNGLIFKSLMFICSTLGETLTNFWIENQFDHS